MNTVGPAISLRTSCCDLPQKEQYSVLLASVLVNFVIQNLPRTEPDGTIPTGMLQPKF
jgi:hypothetical protein